MIFKQVMHARDDDDCSLNPINNHSDTAVIDIDRRMHASAYLIILYLYCTCIFDIRYVRVRALPVLQWLVYRNRMFMKLTA